MFSWAKKKFKKFKNIVAFGFFFSAALTAQNSPELKIHIRNVAQDISVYYSVVQITVRNLSSD